MDRFPISEFNQYPYSADPRAEDLFVSLKHTPSPVQYESTPEILSLMDLVASQVSEGYVSRVVTSDAYLSEPADLKTSFPRFWKIDFPFPGVAGNLWSTAFSLDSPVLEQGGDDIERTHTSFIKASILGATERFNRGYVFESISERATRLLSEAGLPTMAGIEVRYQLTEEGWQTFAVLNYPQVLDDLYADMLDVLDDELTGASEPQPWQEAIYDPRVELDFGLVLSLSAMASTLN